MVKQVDKEVNIRSRCSRACVSKLESALQTLKCALRVLVFSSVLLKEDTTCKMHKSDYGVEIQHVTTYPVPGRVEQMSAQGNHLALVWFLQQFRRILRCLWNKAFIFFVAKGLTCQ